ncbi:MAG: hypothetical protein ACO3ZW_00330 [Opitutales bacterium]|jgi:hypothetical protein
MKRIIKLILNLVLALIAVGLTLVILFFTTPSWQKSVAEQVLARDFARKWQLESVNLQPLGLELEKVYVLDGPIGAEVKFIQMSGPLWKLPFTGVLEVESGSVMGLDIDVSQVGVGDLTSLDYQAFLFRVAGDTDFWQERVALVLSKLSAQGVDVSLRDTKISGTILMPGNKRIPVHWLIVEADSRAPRLIRVQPLAASRPTL